MKASSDGTRDMAAKKTAGRKGKKAAAWTAIARLFNCVSADKWCLTTKLAGRGPGLVSFAAVCPRGPVERLVRHFECPRRERETPRLNAAYITCVVTQVWLSH